MGGVCSADNNGGAAASNNNNNSKILSLFCAPSCCARVCISSCHLLGHVPQLLALSFALNSQAEHKRMICTEGSQCVAIFYMSLFEVISF